MSDCYAERHKYDDMLAMPHHQSGTRPHMSLHDRAAQFAPFQALSGYGNGEKEAAGRIQTETGMDDLTDK